MRGKSRGRRSTVAFLCGLTLTLPPLLGIAGGRAAAATPFTGAAFDSEHGEYIGSGQQYSFSSVTPVGPAADPRFTLGNGTDHFEIDFQAPGGRALGPGTYEDAVGITPSNASPGLDVTGDGRGCSSPTGRFVVDDASYDSAGRTLAFSARFELHCNGTSPALFGSCPITPPLRIGQELSQLRVSTLPARRVSSSIKPL